VNDNQLLTPYESKRIFRIMALFAAIGASLMLTGAWYWIKKALEIL